MEQAMGDMAAAIASPAQQRFFQEMARRLSSSSQKSKE
jgi:hypothetical protein